MAGTTRTSPPTERVVAVLDFLSLHPSRGYGLSELARTVGLSKPTCLGIVAVLVEAGYLTRDERDTTYRLGPALVPLGRAARKSLRANPAGGSALAALARRFGVPVTLSAVVSGRVTVVDGAGAVLGPGDGVPVAAAGILYRLWDADTPGDGLDPVLRRCRDDGYLVELRTPAGEGLHRAVAAGADVGDGALDGVMAGLRDRVLRPDAGEGPHAVSVLSAPVLDAAGRQVMVASLYLDAELTTTELRERGKALIQAVRRVAR